MWNFTGVCFSTLCSDVRTPGATLAPTCSVLAVHTNLMRQFDSRSLDAPNPLKQLFAFQGGGVDWPASPRGNRPGRLGESAGVHYTPIKEVEWECFLSSLVREWSQRKKVTVNEMDPIFYQALTMSTHDPLTFQVTRIKNSHGNMRKVLLSKFFKTHQHPYKSKILW